MKNTRHKTTIYLPLEMLQAFRVLAEKHDRSLNGEMLQGLKLYIENTSQDSPEKKEVHSVSTPIS